MAKEEIKGIIKEVTDTGKEVVETAKERFRNPLISSFIISTIILLWEPISVLILSKTDIEERIIYIKNNFQYEWYYFLIPLAVTVIYVLIVPFVNWGFDLLLNIPNRGISENNRSLEELELIADILFQEKKTNLLNIKNTNKTIDNLNKELNNRELDIVNLNDKNASMQKELTERLQEERQMQDYIELTNEKNGELQDKYDSLVAENNHIRSNVGLKYSDIKKEYIIFRKSELYEYLPEIGVWLSNGTSEKGDKEIANSIQMIMVDTYKEAGLIQLRPEGGMYEFTEKGELFYKIYKGLNSVKKNGIEGMSLSTMIDTNLSLHDIAKKSVGDKK